MLQGDAPVMMIEGHCERFHGFSDEAFAVAGLTLRNRVREDLVRTTDALTVSCQACSLIAAVPDIEEGENPAAIVTGSTDPHIKALAS